MRATRWFAVPAVAALLATAAPALASPGTGSNGAGAGGVVSVALALSPSDPQALVRLANAHGISPAARARRLADLAPRPARREAVATTSVSLGLRVDRSDEWTVRVSGPAARVHALFGQPSRGPDGLAHAFSRLPAGLGRYVVAALPTGGPVARPLAVSGLHGSDFQQAYAAPDGKPTPGAPTLTIATVQLSGWHSHDLSVYAAAAGLPDPIAQGRYRSISVDRASTTRPDGSGGDQEVALDQEAILSSAPYANQRAYFAPNATDGFWDAIHRVGSDAAAFHIAALSISWGGCEYVDPLNPRPDRAFYAAMDQALQYTLAAGVTVFAATGDSGGTDCVGQVAGRAQYQPAVDFPASSPYVVAVGGTNLPDPSDPSTAVAWRHSGGGESRLERRPAYQYSVRSRSTFGGRLVPDIASDADPHTGFDVYDSVQKDSPWLGQVGGTSLGPPVQAAMLTNTLTAHGYYAGIGDIHQALYRAPASAFTDITRGGNGTFSARAGFDKATGRGTPLWSKLAASLAGFRLRARRATSTGTVAITPVLPTGLVYRGWSTPVVDGTAACEVDTTTPPTSATLPRAEGWHTISLAGIDRATAGGGSGNCHVSTARVLVDRHRPTVVAAVRVIGALRARAVWSSSDPAPSSGLLHYVVRIATAGGATVWSGTTTATSHVFDTRASWSYKVYVTAVDRAGNRATRVAHLFDDGALRYSSSTLWQRTSATGAYRTAVHETTRPGPTVRFRVRARRYTLYVATCPRCGVLGVFDGAGHLLRRVDTYSATPRSRVPVLLLASRLTATRTFVVRALHRRNVRSGGFDLVVDALATAAS